MKYHTFSLLTLKFLLCFLGCQRTAQAKIKRKLKSLRDHLHAHALVQDLGEGGEASADLHLVDQDTHAHDLGQTPDIEDTHQVIEKALIVAGQEEICDLIAGAAQAPHVHEAGLSQNHARDLLFVHLRKDLGRFEVHM